MRFLVLLLFFPFYSTRKLDFGQREQLRSSSVRHRSTRDVVSSVLRFGFYYFEDTRLSLNSKATPLCQMYVYIVLVITLFFQNLNVES